MLSGCPAAWLIQLSCNMPRSINEKKNGSKGSTINFINFQHSENCAASNFLCHDNLVRTMTNHQWELTKKNGTTSAIQKGDDYLSTMKKNFITLTLMCVAQMDFQLITVRYTGICIHQATISNNLHTTAIKPEIVKMVLDPINVMSSYVKWMKSCNKHPFLIHLLELLLTHPLEFSQSKNKQELENQSVTTIVNYMTFRSVHSCYMDPPASTCTTRNLGPFQASLEWIMSHYLMRHDSNYQTTPFMLIMTIHSFIQGIATTSDHTTHQFKVPE